MATTVEPQTVITMIGKKVINAKVQVYISMRGCVYFWMKLTDIFE
jgi:hypothetical protein